MTLRTVKKNNKKMQRQNSLPFRFQKKLEIDGFLKRGEKVLVACSGGPDSVALLRLLSALAEPLKLRLGVLHYDHGLRGRASRVDLSFVRQLAKTLKLPFYSAFAVNLRKKAKVRKQSLEEAAREDRYAFFIRTAKKLRVKKIALGHTRDDQAETVLMRLIRGTGLRGLAGIRRALPMAGVTLVRPLLDFTKEELLGWLSSEEIAFRVDASNETEVYERNKIRRLFLPWLKKEIHPRVTETLARLADAAEDENHLMASLEESAWQQLQVVRRGSKLSLNRKAFQSIHPALQFRLLDRALKQINPASGLDFEAWQGLRRTLVSAHADRRSLSRGLDLRLTPSEIFICKPPAVC
jgi:tRNA(Ile)-lysidine synthase